MAIARIMLAGATSLCLLGPVPAYAAPADTLEQALNLAQGGRYAEAKALYQSVLAGNPSPDVRQNVEQALRSIDLLMQAETPPPPAPSRTAAPVAPAPLADRLDSALTLAQAGRYAEAAALYRSILADNPPPDVLRNAAAALAGLEQLEAAQPSGSAPADMDTLFAEGQQAQAEGRFDDAAHAYERMLAADPSLDRVRMDLALVYNQQGEYRKSAPLLKEVLANNPPEIVRQHAEFMLSQAENPLNILKSYGFEGGISTGYNYDSNANSGSSTDAISLFDTTVDLPDGAQAQDDGQAFVAATLGHTYRFAPDKNHPGLATRWVSNGTAYKSEQISLDELDLSLLSLRTGPMIEFTDYGTTLGLTVGYSYVKLGGDHYLSVFSGESDLQYLLSQQVALTGSFSVEDRSFYNSPSISTNEAHSGNAWQMVLGANYAPTPHDAIDGQLLLRQENAQVDYFTDTQYGASAGYTHAFSDTVFANISSGYRESDYDGPDTFISSETRLDKEATAGVTVGKQFEYNILATLGYQYRNVDSNIQNYNYDNHRVMSSVGIRF